MITIRFLLLSICFLAVLGGCKVLYVSEAEVEYKNITESVGEKDPATEALIAPYRDELRASMDEVIGILEVDLVKERPESNMGNWIADIFYAQANVITPKELDFAVMNQGGLRVSTLKKGPILRGEIFELIPFDNIVSVIEASGEEVMSFLHHIAKGKGWPISHQVKFEIKDRQAANVTISDLPIEEGRTYRFAVPDYVAGGGSGSSMLKTMKRTDYDEVIRELAIKHLQEKHQEGVVYAPQIEGRIKNLDHE